MNPISHNPTSQDDDLDRQFSAFFKQEMPEPFPQCRALSETVPSSLVRPRLAGFALRSRLTLAASVAALLGLGLLVSSGVRTPHVAKTPAPKDAPGLINGATANGATLLDPTKGR